MAPPGSACARWLSGRAELGFLLGGGPAYTIYGFDRVPYRSRLTLRAATSTPTGGVNADFKGDFRLSNGRRLVIRADGLNREMIHYFGLGNETGLALDRSFHPVVGKRYVLQPGFELPINRSRTARLQLGGLVQWLAPDPQRVTLLAAEQPYGSGSFTEAGALAGILYDTRDSDDIPTSGVALSLQGRAFPAAFDVLDPFGSVALEGRGYLTARRVPAIPTLALRAGAIQRVGRWPFLEGATLGGRPSFRGTSPRRFVGDRSLYGNAELRFNLGNAGVFGGDWGVWGLTDVGRVWLEGEVSDRWHRTVGGGFWVAVTDKPNVLTVAAAKSSEDKLRFYFHPGFHFSSRPHYRAPYAVLIHRIISRTVAFFP